MCMDGDNLVERIMKQTCFSYFWCEFKIKTNVMHKHVKNNQEHMKNI